MHIFMPGYGIDGMIMRITLGGACCCDDDECCECVVEEGEEDGDTDGGAVAVEGEEITVERRNPKLARGA